MFTLPGRAKKNANWRSSDREIRDEFARIVRMPQADFDALLLSPKVTVGQKMIATYIKGHTAEALGRFFPEAWAEEVEEETSQNFMQTDGKLESYESPAANA